MTYRLNDATLNYRATLTTARRPVSSFLLFVARLLTCYCAVQVLRLGNIVPDFKADTTQGPIEWHKWIDGKWAILFSHPADFTVSLLAGSIALPRSTISARYILSGRACPCCCCSPFAQPRLDVSRSSMTSLRRRESCLQPFLLIQ